MARDFISVERISGLTEIKAGSLTNPVEIALVGDTTGSTVFDGSADVSIATTLTNTGVTPGSFNYINVDEKGRVVTGAAINYISGNETITVTGDVTGVGSTELELSLSLTEVIPGDYGSSTQVPVLTIDAKGRITHASLASIEVDGTSLAVANTNVRRDSNASFAANAITANSVSSGTFVGTLTGNVIGNADTASKFSTSRTITLSGDASGTVSFDGSNNATIATTLANSGVTPGTYASVTVDAKGRITSGTNPSSIAAYGITDAVTTSGDQDIGGIKRFTSTEASNSITTGAVVVLGGLGVSGQTHIGGDLSIYGNLVVSGDTVTVGVSTMTVEDPIISIGNATYTYDDGKDRGVSYNLYSGGSQKSGFFGLSRSSGNFVFIPDAADISGTILGAKGTFEGDLLGNVTGDLTGNVSGNVTGNLTGNVTGSLYGNADTASKLASERTISISGDASASVNFDGSSNVDLVIELSNTGVAAGTYGNTTSIPVIEVDTKGRIVDISHSTIPTATSYSVPNSTVQRDSTSSFSANVISANDFIGNVTGNADSASKLLVAREISIFGDAFGAANFDGSSNVVVTVTHANSGVSAAQYGGINNIPIITVDAKGRITSATTATLASRDTSASANTIVLRDASASFSANVVTANNFVGNLTGNADTATTLRDSRTISLTGDVSGSAIFDGSANASITATMPNSGVAAGTWNNITVNAKGVVTGGANTAYLTENDTITVTGDASGSGRTNISLTLSDSGVSSGTYTHPAFSVDSKGRITSVTNAALTISGDASGTLMGNSISVTLANSGVTVGTYNNLTVDAKGRVTNGTTIPYLTYNETITVTGDAAGTGANAITLTLANSGVTAGSYGNATLIPSITVDAKGRVTDITTNAIAAGTPLAIANTTVQRDANASFAANVVSANAISFTSGGTAERGDLPVGSIRYNTDNNVFEGRSSTGWSSLGTGTAYFHVSMPGELITPIVDRGRFYPPETRTLTRVDVMIAVPSITTDIMIDIKKNGTSILGGTLVTLSAGQYYVTRSISGTITTSDYLTVDVQQGNGTDLTLRFAYQ